jgi:hypothetical protein
MMKASRQGHHSLWLSTGYGVQALGQVTAKIIHPVLQEVKTGDIKLPMFLCLEDKVMTSRHGRYPLWL